MFCSAKCWITVFLQGRARGLQAKTYFANGCILGNFSFSPERDRLTKFLRAAMILMDREMVPSISTCFLFYLSAYLAVNSRKINM